jgi:hypothetical protein
MRLSPRHGPYDINFPRLPVTDVRTTGTTSFSTMFLADFVFKWSNPSSTVWHMYMHTCMKNISAIPIMIPEVYVSGRVAHSCCSAVLYSQHVLSIYNNTSTDFLIISMHRSSTEFSYMSSSIPQHKSSMSIRQPAFLGKYIQQKFSPCCLVALSSEF